MGYFDRHPAQFRILLIALAAYLVGIGLTNLIYIVSTITDENLFTDPPSRLYLVRSFPATLQQSSGLLSAPRSIPDSVLSGNLLLAVNGTRVDSSAQVMELLRNADNADYSTFDVYLLRERTKRTYRVRKALIPENFVRDIPPTAYVVDVIAGGASDQAGMQVGDLIVSINGRRFGNVLEADEIMRQGRAGLTIEYEVLRDNTTRTLHLTLARVRLPLPLFTVFLCGFIYIGAGGFIGFKQPRLKAARLLSLAFLCIGYVWLASSNGGSAVPQVLGILRGFTFLPAIFFGIAFWQHASIYFPAEQPVVLSRRWIYRTQYVLAGLLTALAFLLIILRQYQDLLLLAGATAMLLFAVSVALRYRKQFSAEYRRMSRPIHFTLLTAVGVFVAVTVAGSLFSDLQTPWTLPFITASMAAIPLIYLYVIGRYRLLGLQLRVRRTIQYSALSTTWKASILIIAFSTLYLLTQLDLDVPNLRFTGIAVEIPREPISLQERVVLEKITIMIAAICFTFAFWEIGRAGQNYINRMYYRSDYDYRQAANDFADVIATKLTLEGLAAGVVQKLAESVHLKRTGMVIFREDTIAQYTDYTADGDSEATEPPTPPPPALDGTALIEALAQFHGGFSVDYLPRTLKEAMRARGFLHLIPIRSKDGIIGVIAIGEKMSEADVEREDLAFLEAVSRQTAVAVENAFLYEEIAEQDRMRHELAIAREIQLASLPQTTPDLPGLDIAGVSCPATEVGGDYFDYLNGAPGSMTVIVGDVSGKGTSAALYMSKVQGILRSLHAFDLSPRDLFIRTNQLLYNDLDKKGYVTALSACFDTATRQSRIARAGHLPLLYFHRSTGTVRRILPRGLGLGMVSSAVFSPHLDEQSIAYEPGDVFLFVTDGITEAMNEHREEFGEERLTALLCAGADTDAEALRDSIRSAVQEFTGTAALHDDFTVVVVKAV